MAKLNQCENLIYNIMLLGSNNPRLRNNKIDTICEAFGIWLDPDDVANILQSALNRYLIRKKSDEDFKNFITLKIIYLNELAKYSED